MQHPSSFTANRERGAAALIVTLVMFLAMALVAIFVNRNLVFEQRSAANQVRSTQAFEAAEAGLEWALAQLNDPQRIGPDCKPSADPAATSFRSRHLVFNRTTAGFTPAVWNHAGTPTALQPSCVRTATGWSCSCPLQGLPTLVPLAGNAPAVAFTLQFAAGAKPGTVRVVATGCSHLAGVCQSGSTTRADATAKIEVALGLVAGLRTPPAAALTTRGAFDADAAALGLRNPDPATGIALHAGGTIAASHAQLTAPAGAPLSSTLVGNDTALASLSTDRFFASYFGLDKAAWKSQPTVTRVTCSGNCSSALAAAIDAAADTALVWVDGDLDLAGPITLGSPQRPVVIIASGAARLNGAIAVHGVIYAAALRWDSTSGGAFVRGAALSESSYQGNGTPEFFYDTTVLATLKSNSGSFARVSGSWRDF
jgi:PilX N-terminal